MPIRLFLPGATGASPVPPRPAVQGTGSSFCLSLSKSLQATCDFRTLQQTEQHLLTTHYSRQLNSCFCWELTCRVTDQRALVPPPPTPRLDPPTDPAAEPTATAREKLNAKNCTKGLHVLMFLMFWGFFVACFNFHHSTLHWNRREFAIGFK